MSAFEKYLLSIPRPDAVHHLMDCLRSGRGEMAWELLEKVNGEWRCPPNEIPEFLLKTLEKLEKGEFHEADE